MSKQKSMKPEEKHVELLMKEFDMDRYKAANILKRNECNLRLAIKYCLTN